jgi:endonuclease/exonuclease/phosphatase family metal-dependent hydrolase
MPHESAAVYVLTWNLFHGRAKPAAGRPLLVEFARALAGWEWDVALLQEVPPWWPPALAHAAGAQHRTSLTSRNSLLAVRAAIARRNPDLIGANGGGANAILVRGEILDHAEIELTRRPERRTAHAVRLASGVWVANLHASTDPKEQTRRDVARAQTLGAAVLGGDFNLRDPGMPTIASHHVDHIVCRAGRDAQVLDAGTLSDHRPLRAFAEARSRAA